MSVFRTSEATTIGVKQRTTSKLFVYDNPNAFRYWRYVIGSTVVGHHPMSARIIFVDRDGNSTNAAVYAADNCADTGSWQFGTASYDFGTNRKEIVRAQIYSSYGGGQRSSNYSVQYSIDNTNWNTYFSGVMANYNYSTNGAAACGIFSGTGFIL